MSYHVRVLARARQDLDDILAFVAKRSPEGAAHRLASFEKCLTMLEKNPFLSPLPRRAKNFRTSFATSHSAPEQVVPTGLCLSVLETRCEFFEYEVPGSHLLLRLM
jgi:plasmid stabilization system protein ParE